MAIKVRIQLTEDLPINKVHGCTAGKEYDAEYRDTYLDDKGKEQVARVRGTAVKFKSEDGCEVVAFSEEYKVISA